VYGKPIYVVNLEGFVRLEEWIKMQIVAVVVLIIAIVLFKRIAVAFIIADPKLAKSLVIVLNIVYMA